MNNKEEIKKHAIISVILFVVFILYTLLVLKVDVSNAGPNNIEVGFSKINGAIADKIVFNKLFYTISKLLGLLAFAFVGFFGLLGLLQAIQKKSIIKVDKDIYVLGCFYVLVLITYFVFEKVVLNYRPVILDEGLEPSYPSSHTILGVCVFVTAAMQFKKRLANEQLRNIVVYACYALAAILVITRFLSGVHWLTDIIGGILVSAFLISLYDLGLYVVNRK